MCSYVMLDDYTDQSLELRRKKKKGESDNEGKIVVSALLQCLGRYEDVKVYADLK